MQFQNFGGRDGAYAALADDVHRHVVVVDHALGLVTWSPASTQHFLRYGSRGRGAFQLR
ncbi:hypothetical protein D3C71_2206110 [compost metagenome]